jgi:hypothetical protein
MKDPVHMNKDLTLPNDRRIVEYTQQGQVPDPEKITNPAPLDGRLVECYGWMDDQGTGHLYITWQGYPEEHPGKGSSPKKPEAQAILKKRKRGGPVREYEDWTR